VYAPDKLGQGHTDNPKTDGEFTMTSTIEHIHGFMRAVDARGAVLVGHSRGALPAARIAVDHPELVKALVIIDTRTLSPDHPSTPPDFYAALRQDAPAIPDEAYVRREPDANSYSKDHVTKDFLDEALKIARLPKTQVASDKMVRLLKTQFLPDVRQRKYETLDMIRDGRLGVPTLVVWGLNDPSAPIVLGYRLFELLGLSVPRAELHVFNHSGHYPFREHADEFDRLLVDFVDATH
jgi:pimeloyl-ACP methyl ester carboxylesterase